ncbi:MAG: hypothetical protein ACI865_002981, partial [Flavobacteriaceae bacterium]
MNTRFTRDNRRSTFLKGISLLMLLGFSFTSIAQLTVTKSYVPGSSVSIDGCGTYCSSLPSVSFSPADFSAGACAITDVNVNIVWAKTDGTCSAPGVGSSFHTETSFRLDGPTGTNEILVLPGTYSGNGTISSVSTTFDQGFTVVGGVDPVSGTFGPNNGNLNNYNGTSPFGNWALRAGDNAGGDPLCVASYSVTITVSTGTDTDGDGICDLADPDDDNDGVADGSDTAPLDPFVCADADADGCDDCAIGIDGFGPLADNTPANDGIDTDGDGLCDTGDPDIDGDGCPNGSDPTPTVATVNPDVPLITATPSTICAGSTSTLDWSGASLNDATNWHIYTGGCGTTQLTSQTGTSLIVSPTFTTTYYIRGEDGTGCVDESTGACGSITITVNALPTVTFTALADLCIDAGVQAGLGSGTPTGGVYSGPGVTDDGNGNTYSFDPAAAGAGTHTITYNFTDGNGCSGSANDNVVVFGLPTVSFAALGDLCLDAGNQTGLTGGSPAGGIYSGPGVTDAGNGTNYSFDPAAAGVGTHIVTYNFTDGNGCSGSANDNVVVFGLPTVTFTALADLCVNAGNQTGLTGGSPAGGVYSGPGVTDAGNGTNYSFDPAVAGVGTHTITYNFTDGNGCSGSANDNVVVFALPTVTFTAPSDLCIDAGVQAGLGSGTPTGGVYSGPGVTDDGNGNTYSFDPAA